MAVNVHGDRSLYFKSGIDNSGLKRGSREAKGILKNLSSYVSKTDIFVGLGTAAAAAFSKMASAAFNFRKKFEQNMREVSTISQQVSQNFEGFQQQIIELSTEVPDDANKLSKALYQAVSAGYDGAEGMKVLRTASKAAVAGVTDTKTAVDGLTTVLNAFSKDTEEVTEVADVMFQTVKNGKTTFDQLSQALPRVASMAGAMGISFKEISAAMATMTAQGTKTEEAVTQLRQVVMRMSDALGSNWQKHMSLQEAMQKVYNQADGNVTKIKELIGSEEAVAAVMQMAGDQAQRAAQHLEDAKNSTGSMIGAFQKMKDTTENQMKIFSNNLDAYILNPLGKALNQAASAGIEALNELFGWDNSRVEKAKELQTQVNNLATEITTLKEGTDARKNAIERLQSVYPNYFKNLNAEKATNKQIRDRMREVNKEMTKRIVLAEEMDKLDKAKEERKESGKDVQAGMGEMTREMENRVRTLREQQGIMEDYQMPTGSVEDAESAYQYAAKYYTDLKIQLQEFIDKHSQTTEQAREYAIEINKARETLKWLDVHMDKIKKSHEDHVEAKQREERLQEKINKRSEKYLDTQKEINKEESKGSGGSGGSGISKPDDYNIESQLSAYNEKRQLLGSIASQIKALDKASETYNQAEKRRIKQQIEMWKHLYTQIAEAQKMGHDKWEQKQVDSTLNQMTGSSGLAEMRSPERSNYDLDVGQGTAARNLQENLEKINSQFYELGQTMGEFDSEISKAIQGISSSVSGFTQILGGMSQYKNATGAVGKMLGGVGMVGGALSIVGSMASMAERQEKQRQIEVLNDIKENIDQTNQYLNAQLNEIKQSEGKAKIQNMQNYLQDLQKESDKYWSKIKGEVKYQGKAGVPEAYNAIMSGDGLTEEEVKKIMNNSQFQDPSWGENFFQSITPFNALGEKSSERMSEIESTSDKSIKKYYEQFKDLQNKIEKWQTQYRRHMTGATAGGIADGFAQALKEGKSFSEAFSENFQEAMRSAIIQSFKNRFLAEQIDSWMKQFAKASEGGLTEKERENLEKELKSNLQGAKDMWPKVQDMLESTGLDFDDETQKQQQSNNMTGQIKGVTEETAGLLVGQIQAMRMNVAEQVAQNRTLLTYQAKIASNTSHNRHLVTIKNALTENDGGRSQGQ